MPCSNLFPCPALICFHAPAFWRATLTLSHAPNTVLTLECCHIITVKREAPNAASITTRTSLHFPWHSQCFHYTVNAFITQSMLPLHTQCFHYTVNASITQSMLSWHSQCFHYTVNASMTQSILPLHSQYFHNAVKSCLHSQCFHYTVNASMTQSILPLHSQQLLALCPWLGSARIPLGFV